MKALWFAAAAVVVSAPAFAQVRIDVQLPSIVFPAPPPLVVVQPGVQVVEDSDDEVYFVDNYYWHRRGAQWFRTRTHTGGWAVVEPRMVPQTIVAMPVGKYRKWHHEVREERHEERHEERQERHEDKHEEKGHGNGKHGKH